MPPDVAAPADQLREAARHARRLPDDAVRLATQATEALSAMDDLEAPRDDGGRPFFTRLRDNIAVGMRSVRTNPGMMTSYCRNAADEIEAWAARRAKGERHE